MKTIKTINKRKTTPVVVFDLETEEEARKEQQKEVLTDQIYIRKSSLQVNLLLEVEFCLELMMKKM